MDISMIFDKKVAMAVCFLLMMTSGCSSKQALLSNADAALTTMTSMTADTLKNLANKDKPDINESVTSTNSDIQALKEKLELQQQQLQTINAEQLALQEQLKRQSIVLQIRPSPNANAGRNKLGTASTATIGFLEEDSQFAELDSLAVKELSIIPNRESNTKLNLPQDARFIAIKIGLRYTKKRSQFLIPIASLDFDQPLVLEVGACDVAIKQGIDPALTPKFTTKLKFYQQPLVSCT